MSKESSARPGNRRHGDGGPLRNHLLDEGLGHGGGDRLDGGRLRVLGLHHDEDGASDGHH